MHLDVERLDQRVSSVARGARGRARRKPPSEGVDARRPARRCIAELRAGTICPLRGQLARARALPARNRAELAVVFRNLLENAAKYSDHPVEIHVRVAAKSEGRIDVAISDRGIGIPARELRKIFQRFYRAGRDVQRTAAGLGLGLFIVRNLVRRQGGRVVARSAGSGAGTALS